MSLIRQEEVYAAAGTPWAQAIEMVAGVGGVAKYDVVVANAVSAVGSVIPKAVKTDADALDTHSGILMVATGAAAAGGKFLAVPWVVITGVDTSGKVAGRPVYLGAATAGTWVKTKPTGVGEAIVVVGSILVVGVGAADGVVMLKPGGVAVDGFKKVGTAAVPTGVGGVTVALGTNFANGRVVATWAADPGGDQSLFASIHATTGVLTIKPTASISGGPFNCTYVAYSALI